MHAIRPGALLLACALAVGISVPFARGAVATPSAADAAAAGATRSHLARTERAASQPVRPNASANIAPPERTALASFEPSSALVPRPVTVYLHGLCGEPTHGCPVFREGVTETSYLVCPRAPVACPGGGAAWRGSVAAQRATIRRAVDELVQREGEGAVDRTRPGVLIGFSEGGYVVSGLVRSGRARGMARAVAIIAARVSPSVEELRAAGIHRVLFAAGRRDGTHAALVAATRELVRRNYPARFLDLGNVGHTYVPARDAPGWREALAWLEAAE